MPSSITNLGEAVFAHSYSLSRIAFNGTKAQWENIEKTKWSTSSRVAEVVCLDGTIKYYVG